MITINTDWINEDKRLSADTVDAKYNPEGDGEHPYFTRWDWKQAVASESTLSGYWEWIVHRLDGLNWE